MARFYPSGGAGGADTSVVTAGAGDILSGKVIVDAEGNPLTGTMPNNGAVAPSALGAGGSYTIPAGYHNGSGIVTVQSLATLTASADATAAQILSGKKAYVDGSLITGSMVDRGAQTKTITPSASAQSYTIPAGYHNGSGKVSVPAVSNLTAANIKKGVVVGGVTGTWSGYVATATDLYLRGNNVASWTLGGTDTSLQSGAIYKSGMSFFTLTSTKAYNLSPYTKINVEINIIARGGNKYAGFGFYAKDSSNKNLFYGVATSTSTGTVTISLDISSVNVTPAKLFMEFASTDASQGLSNTYVTFEAQVYRIWLS